MHQNEIACGLRRQFNIVPFLAHPRLFAAWIFHNGLK
jgi:hypothetical protein